MNRRQFLEVGLVASLGTAAARQLLAASQASGKPVLTAKNLQAHLNGVLALKDLGAAEREASTDLRKYVEKRFTLAADQARYFDQTYAKDKPKWNEFIRRVATISKENAIQKKAPPRAVVLAANGVGGMGPCFGVGGSLTMVNDTPDFAICACCALLSICIDNQI
jgi:hypothetical protein